MWFYILFATAGILISALVYHFFYRLTAVECKRTGTVNIIFDFNNVLFQLSIVRILFHLGVKNTIVYFLSGNSIAKLEDNLFDTLNLLPSNTKPKQDPSHIPTHKDRPLPGIMQDWLRGEVTGTQIIKQVNTLLASNNHKKIKQLSSREKTLILNLIKTIFQPQIAGQLYKPSRASIRILKQCKKCGYKTYMMSNLDGNVISNLMKRYHSIFSLFDGIAISSEAKKIKPEPEFYKFLLEKYQLSPQTCYLIDDQPENVAGARKIGITSILYDCTKENDLFKKLRDYDLL